MANTAPIFVAAPHLSGATFVAADGTTLKEICAATENGTRIDGVTLCTDDTSDQVITFALFDGDTAYQLGSVVLPAGSGYTTIAAVDALARIAPPGVGALVLAGNWSLQATPVAAVSADKTTTVLVSGGTY